MNEWLLLAGFFAGFIDSGVGGGGAITLPALLAGGLPPHVAVASNKVAGTGASSMATWQYWRGGLLSVPLLRWTMPLAFGASIVGAATVLRIPADGVLGLVAAMVVAITVYVLVRPRFGTGAPRPLSDRRLLAGAGLAIAVGFYDGVLGPGTGNLLLFGLVAWLGQPYLQAAANGRALNFASNAGALGYFLLAGTIAWAPALLLTVGTTTGALVGSRVSMRHGARWIRPLFVVVALGLVARVLLG